jgi:hypothetical protein
MKLRAGVRLIGGLFVILVLVGACTERGTIAGSDEGVEGEREDSSSAPELPAFDPPTVFDNDGMEVLLDDMEFDDEPLLPVSLHGTKVFTMSESGMRIVDIATGETSDYLTRPKTSEDDGGTATDEVLQAPWILETNGAVLALVPYIVYKPTSGTEAPGRLLELVAFDADTEEAAWVAQVELNGWTTADWMDVVVIGADEEEAILGLFSYDYDYAETIAVSTRTQETLWNAPSFWPRTTVGDLLLGYNDDLENSPMTSLSTADGSEVWAQPERSGGFIAAVSPDLIVVWFHEEWDEYRTEKYFDFSFQFLDTATGDPVAVYDLAWEHGVGCEFDGTEYFACSSDAGTGSTIGYSAVTGEMLWDLPAEGRVSVDVTAARHGAVYGSTSNGSVVLDAATGADMEGEPGMAPRIVNEYGGIDAWGEDQVAWMPAIG